VYQRQDQAGRSAWAAGYRHLSAIMIAGARQHAA